MKKRILSVLIGFGLCQSGVWGNGKVESPSVVELRPFSGKDVELEASWIKQREDLDVAYLQSVEADRLLHNFRVTAGLPSLAKPLEGWESPGVGLRGHFTGHYLSALSVLAERYGDGWASQRLEYMVDELYKCQQAHGNGYLSAFPEKDFETLETRFTGVWAPYYTLHKILQGLLDAYTKTGNRKAYGMVEALAGYVEGRMSKLSPKRIERMMYTVEANPQNEAGAMNEVLYELYGISGNPKHLALAACFDPAWFLEPLVRNEDILAGLHANTHLPAVTR